MKRDFGDNQSKLAAYLHTNPSTVNAWFTGRNRPSEKWCYRLAEVLKVSPEEVLAAAGKVHERPTMPADEAALPTWVRLIPALTRDDQDYIQRLVEAAFERPVRGSREDQPGERQP